MIKKTQAYRMQLTNENKPINKCKIKRVYVTKKVYILLI